MKKKTKKTKKKREKRVAMAEFELFLRRGELKKTHSNVFTHKAAAGGALEQRKAVRLLLLQSCTLPSGFHFPPDRGSRSAR